MKYIDGNDSDYTLSVNQFARLCGTTRDTLRHYYEIGLLMPKINKSNGYHYYSPSQINTYYFINTFRSIGSPIKEIEEMMDDPSRENILNSALNRLDDIQSEITKLNKRAMALNLWTDILKKYRPGNEVGIDTLYNVHTFCTPVEDVEHAFHTSNVSVDINHHLGRLSKFEDFNSFPIGVTMDFDDLSAGKYVYNNIVSLTMEDDGGNSFKPLSSTRVAGCYHDNAKKDIRRTYRRILGFLKKNNLEACSDLYIISLVNMYAPEGAHAYFKYLFVCVK